MADCTTSAMIDLLNTLPVPIHDRVNVAESLVQELESRIAAMLQGTATHTSPDSSYAP